MHVRVAVIDNGIGKVKRLNYLCDVQRRIEQGKALAETVCMECVGWLCPIWLLRANQVFTQAGSKNDILSCNGRSLLLRQKYSGSYYLKARF